MPEAAMNHPRGLDHDRFPFRTIREQTNFQLPASGRVALNLIVVLQRFHIDAKPAFPFPGMIDRPYPDVGNATQREVGLRSGFWRICELIDDLNIPTTFVVERDALPLLKGEDILREARHEIVAGGQHAALLHTSAMTEDGERRIIRECRDALTDALSRPVIGWRSPSCAQSSSTLDFLADEGFVYCGDFNNDDRPYALTTRGVNRLIAMPMNHFSSDLHGIVTMKQPTQLYYDAVKKGTRWILGRKNQAPVILPLVIHPWISGVPHRIDHLRNLLKEMLAFDGLTTSNSRELAECFKPAV